MSEKNYYNDDNYIERAGELHEITVTITLAEYRALIEDKCYSEKAIGQLQEENELLRKKNEKLQTGVEALEKRLKHLLQSNLVRQYDEYEPCACDYKYDIKELDEDYRIKNDAYYLLKSLTTCNVCARQLNCKYKRLGDNVVYNCPHYEE